MNSNRKATRKSKRKPNRRYLLYGVFGALACWGVLVTAIQWSAQPYIFDRASLVPTAPVGIVLGAGVLKTGQPSQALKERLDGAIELYRAGKVSRLLMSGDNRTTHYNEPKAMRAYALKNRVDSHHIEMDFAGRDTYDTCYRAKHVFGIDRAIFITQQYHAPRAVYMGRAMGIEAYAYGVRNLTQFPLLQTGFSARELCADLKAVWDISVTHRKPYVAMGSRKQPSWRGQP